ncbi:hypothetical protein B5S29_g4709 [[Candida] boidinii]|nr:hypothetical protein B5S29_g4709 [[Candida] boidinii]
MVQFKDITYSSLSLDISKISKFEFDLKLNKIMDLINKYLSEPYSIYVFRFFLNNWPELCILAHDSTTPNNEIIGCIISKVETHKDVRIRGYIGMLAVDYNYRSLGIAKNLIDKNLNKMINEFNCDEIILETEVVNKKALKLYENFGFIRTKRLFRYYLNKHDAFRLILPLSDKSIVRSPFLEILDEKLTVRATY